MIKTLAKQIKEYKRASLVTPIFMILEVAMEMVIPLLMASIIDDGVQAGDMKHIFVIGCYMVLAAIVGLFAGVMGGKYGAKASTGFARNLREAMYENIQICTTMYRTSRFPTLISSPPQDWSHV